MQTSCRDRRQRFPMKKTVFHSVCFLKNKLLKVMTISVLSKCIANVRNKQPVCTHKLKQEQARDKETGRENDR